MVLLVLPPPDHLWIGRKSRQFLPSQRCSSMTNAAERTPAEILALGPSCVSATPQLKREWSLRSEFGWIPGNLCDLSKGYFATTFLSSSLTWPATQSGVDMLRM